MTGDASFQMLADAVLAVHFAFVGFVVLGLALIVLGGVRRWSWVRNPVFRLAHLSAIAIVVAQAWLGVVCPLTTLEMALRRRAGAATYTGSFIAHWLGQLLYYEAACLDVRRRLQRVRAVGRRHVVALASASAAAPPLR